MRDSEGIREKRVLGERDEKKKSGERRGCQTCKEKTVNSHHSLRERRKRGMQKEKIDKRKRLNRLRGFF